MRVAIPNRSRFGGMSTRLIYRYRILLSLDLGLLAAIATSPKIARTVGGLPASIPGQ